MAVGIVVFVGFRRRKVRACADFNLRRRFFDCTVLGRYSGACLVLVSGENIVKELIGLMPAALVV